MKLKNLIKTYGFWTSLAGAVVVLVNAVGKACGFKIEDKLITDIIMAVAGVLVVFGVVSLPKELYIQNEKGEGEKKEQSQQNDEDKKK